MVSFGITIVAGAVYACCFWPFLNRVYTVDFWPAALRSLFTARAGDNVVDTGIYKDSLTKQEVLVVSAEKSFHFLAPDGSPLVSIPRVHDCFGYHIALGKLADPQRYFAWYQPYPWALFVEPAVSGTLPILFHEYDAGGRELAHHDHPQFPYPMASYKKASFGLVTPMTEAATLVGVSQHLRSVGHTTPDVRPPVLLDYLENIQYYIPGTSPVRSYASRIDSRLYRFDPALGDGLCGARLCRAGPPLCVFRRPRDWLGSDRLHVRLGRLDPDARTAGMARARVSCPECR